MLRLMGSAPMRELDALTNVFFRMAATRFGVGVHLSKEGRRAFLGGFRRRGARRALHQLMRDVRHSKPLFAEVERGLATELRDRPLLTIFSKGNDPFGFQAGLRLINPEAHELVAPGMNHFPMCSDPDTVADAVMTWYATNVA